MLSSGSYARTSNHQLTRKRPRHDDKTDDDDDETELFSCSICLETPTEASPPIQCGLGHILCLRCSRSIHSCPVCRMQMDPANPIRCLVAQQIMEKKKQKRNRAKELLLCSGGCGWTGRDKTLFDAHERGCTAALNSKLAQLEEKNAEITEIAAKLVSEMKELKTLVAAQKEEFNAKKNESTAGVGNVFAAWRACVEAYQSNPVVGAEILVGPNNIQRMDAVSSENERFQWLQLHCIVPGIMFLAGARLEFTALYNPQTLQARCIKRLHIDGDQQRGGQPFDLEDEEAELSLSRLVQAMQHYALHGYDEMVDSKSCQLRYRCKAFDEEGKFTRPSGFVSLDKSKFMHTTKKPRSPAYWKFSTDGKDPLFPKLVPRWGVMPDQSLVNEEETPSKKLKVTNLPFFSKEANLKKFFTDAGFHPIICSKDNSTKYRKISYGYVYFNSYTEALEAMDRLNGAYLSGRSVIIFMG